MALVQEKQLGSDPLYDELVSADPGFEHMAANEPAGEEEQAHYDYLFSDFIDALHGPQEANAVKMLETAPELYVGVSEVAFTILRAVQQKYEQKEGPVDPSIYFGEGGMIMTAVDEVFKMAQAIGIPGSDDMDQYSAAQMNMMKKVGELVEQGQEDGAVDEAQELMIDIEMGGGADVPPLSGEERAALREAAGEPVPEEVPVEAPVPAAPPSGGLI